MRKQDTYQLKFWGTRGSLPVNSPAHRKYGGNSSCVEIRLQGQCIILDGGSGLSLLGECLMAQMHDEAAGRENCEAIRDIDIFISHFHNDHICGFPFFAPFFDTNFTIRLHYIIDERESRTANSGTDRLQSILENYMSPPFYPAGPEIFKANYTFCPHKAGEIIKLGQVRIIGHPVPHPGGCHAYRIADGRHDIVYATDTEHMIGKRNESLMDFIKNSDLLIYDGTYDDDDFARYIGFGHSSWQEGIRLCRAANIKKLAIFHHAPQSTDYDLDKIAVKAGKLWPDAFVAADFQAINLDE